MALAESLAQSTLQGAEEFIASIEDIMKKAAQEGKNIIVVNTFDDMDNQHILSHFRAEHIYSALRRTKDGPVLVFRWGYKPSLLRRIIDALFVRITKKG